MYEWQILVNWLYFSRKLGIPLSRGSIKPYRPRQDVLCIALFYLRRRKSVRVTGIGIARTGFSKKSTGFSNPLYKVKNRSGSTNRPNQRVEKIHGSFTGKEIVRSAREIRQILPTTLSLWFVCNYATRQHGTSHPDPKPYCGPMDSGPPRQPHRTWHNICISP
jgi:hypothetical protein